MTYHIGTRNKGVKRQGGWRPPWLDYFGDERASLIKFGMERFDPENSTLRRNRCELGHLFSVDVSACPVCALAREEVRVAVDIAAMTARVLARKPGDCRYCGEPLPPRRAAGSGRQIIYCDPACSRGYWNQRRGKA